MSRYKETEGGIVVPKEKDEDLESRPGTMSNMRGTFVFHCSYMEECVRFIDLLFKEKAHLICATCQQPGAMRPDFYVTYCHYEEIGMEVMT